MAITGDDMPITADDRAAGARPPAARRIQSRAARNAGAIWWAHTETRPRTPAYPPQRLHDAPRDPDRDRSRGV